MRLTCVANGMIALTFVSSLLANELTEKFEAADRERLTAWERLEEGFRYRYAVSEQYMARFIRDGNRKTVEIIEAAGDREASSGQLIYRDNQYLAAPDNSANERHRGILVGDKEISRITRKGSRVATVPRTSSTERDAIGYEVFRPINNQAVIFGFPWQSAYLMDGDRVELTRIQMQGEGYLVTSRRQNAKKPYKADLTCDYDFQPVGNWLLPKSITHKADGITNSAETFEWKVMDDIPIPVRMSSTQFTKDPKSGKMITALLKTFEIVDGSFELRKNSAEPDAWDELAVATALPDLTDPAASAQLGHYPSLPSAYLICLGMASSIATLWMVRRKGTEAA